MDTIEQVKNLLGTSYAQYLQNKHTGGTSNSKGNSYENIFTVYQVALFSKDVIDNYKKIYVLSQTQAFVDDLVIERDGDISLFCHSPGIISKK